MQTKKSIKKELTVILLAIGVASCHPKIQEQNNSKCLDAKIAEFAKESCNKASVKEYEFQQKKVYVFDQAACGNDMAADVYDANCQKLGFIGGFIGNTNINGEDFSNAKLLRTVWEAKP